MATAAEWLRTGWPETADCEQAGAWAALFDAGDAAARARALDALRGCGGPWPAAVATRALTDPDPTIAGAALRLAGDRFAAGDEAPALLDAVAVAMVDHPSAAVRYEAVEAFDAASWTGDPRREAQLLAALGDDVPTVVAEAIERATYRSAGIAAPDAWRSTMVFAAQAHLDPGIRGAAALLLARLAPASPGIRDLLRRGLGDKHPYTRSAHAAALADAGDLAAVHLLIARLDDDARNEWVMLPWTATDGKQRRQIFIGSHLERVDDALLRAIESLTVASLGDDGYRLRPISLRYLDLDLIAARRDARAWYAAHQGALPPPPE